MSKIKNYLKFVNEETDYDYMEDMDMDMDMEEVEVEEDGMSAEEVRSAADLRAENAPQTFIDTPQDMGGVAADNTVPAITAVPEPAQNVMSFSSYMDGAEEGIEGVEDGIEGIEPIDSIEGLEGIEGLEDIEGIEDMGDVEISDMDMEEMEDDCGMEEEDGYMGESTMAVADKSLSKDGHSGGKKEKDSNPKDNPISDTTDVQTPNVKKFGDFKDGLKAQDLSTDGNTKVKRSSDPTDKDNNPISAKADKGIRV